MDATQGMPERELDLRSILAVLRRQVRIILWTAAAIFAAAALFLLLVSPRYTASALVLVDPQSKNILGSGTAMPLSSGRENARVDSEVEILRSDAVALAVIRDRALTTDREFGAGRSLIGDLARMIGVANAAPAAPAPPISQTLERFRKAVHVRRKGLTYLISVSATSHDAQKAAQLANATARTYIGQQIDAKVATTLAARDVLRGQIAQAHETLIENQRRIDAFLASHTQADGSGLGALQRRLQQADKAQETVRKLAQDSDWAKLAKALQDSQMHDLATQREALVRHAGAPRGDFSQQLSRIDAALTARAQNAQQARQREIDTLRRQIRDTIDNGTFSPDVVAGVYTLNQEAEIARAQYQSLLSRMRDLETEARIQIADSRLVSPAIAPSRASFPNRTLVLLAAMAASLGLGVSFAFLKEYYIGGITSVTQLGDLLQRPTTAMIPQAPAAPQALSIADQVINAPLSPFAESIRKLRASLDQGLRRSPTVTPAAAQVAVRGLPAQRSLGKGQIIMVTSARPDEGKSTTALALARTYALAGRKTLLIDADLRMPSLHRHLGHQPEIGFLDFLREEANGELAGSFYARDPASPLAVVMGAHPSDVPTDQLLGSSRFEALMAQARDVYEIIVIDTPPLLPVVDALYVAQHADAVLMLVKWAGTPQGDLRAATTPLMDAMPPGALLLPVLGQMPEHTDKARYGSYGTMHAPAT